MSRASQPTAREPNPQGTVLGANPALSLLGARTRPAPAGSPATGTLRALRPGSAAAPLCQPSLVPSAPSIPPDAQQ